MKYIVSLFKDNELFNLINGIKFGFDPNKKLGALDERRKIEECNRENDSWQRFEVYKANLPLANHFHRNKSETFYFTEGKGTIYLVPVTNDGRINGTVEKVEVKPGVRLFIPPYVAHRFNMEAGARFVNHSSTPFNPDNEDMYHFIVPIVD